MEASTEIFRFSDLPPELREMVYDELASDAIEVASPELEANLSVQEAPLTPLLLVSREIGREYRKVAAKKTTLVFSDHENFNFTLLPLPARVLNVTKIAVRNFVVCEDKCPSDRTFCEAASDLQQTLDFIHKINTQLPDKTLYIDLGLWCKEGEKCEWPDTPHRDDVVKTLQRLPEALSNLARVKVYRSNPQNLEPGKLVDPSRLLVSWSKKEGWSS